MAFLHPVKVVRDVFEDKCQIWSRFSEAKVLQVDLYGLHDISTSGYNEVRKTSTIEREYSKTKENRQKLITKRKRKAPLLA